MTRSARGGLASTEAAPDVPRRRHPARPSRAVLALAAAGLAAVLVGCQEHSGWTVESSHYSGQRGGPGEHYVTCVPTEDYQQLPQTQRTTWREVHVDEDTATTADSGQPCPPGPIRMSHE